MIRKHTWLGLAFVVAGSFAAACSDDGSASDGSGGSNGTGAMGGEPGSGATSGSGANASTGGSGTGASGSGGSSVNVIPPGNENFDCSGAAGAAPTLELTPIVTGLNRPVFLTHAPNDSTRMFVLEQDGLLKVIKNNAALPAPFLDLTSVVVRDDDGHDWDERGLLGLAFHPKFAQNGLVYVYHTRGTDPQEDVIAEYKVSDEDPDVLDVSTRRDVLVIEDPATNHNGGTIQFGGDGFLYFLSGDGGGSDNQHKNAQNPETLLGKALRIDVDKRDAGQYGIPAGNLEQMPEMNDADGLPAEGGALVDCEPEIWDYGLRNPYRWSFDGCTGDLYIGEVGQGKTEEVNIEAPQTGHRNYGWPVTEGNDCYLGGPDCDKTGITFPVTTRPTNTSAIQGGYVYRGSNIPGLRGTYLFGKYVEGTVFSLNWDGTTANNVTAQPILTLPRKGPQESLLSFGQDADGEIYALGNQGGFDTGVVYRIDQAN